MRMWMIHPKFLCRQHLLGEHVELHKHLPTLRKGHNIKGRFYPIVQIQLDSIKSRHDELANEIIRRGYNHQSPLNDIPDLKALYPLYYNVKVDINHSLTDLCDRCKHCKERIMKMAKRQPDNSDQLRKMTDEYNRLVDESGIGSHQPMFKHISEAETMLADIKNKIRIDIQKSVGMDPNDPHKTEDVDKVNAIRANVPLTQKKGKKKMAKKKVEKKKPVTKKKVSQKKVVTKKNTKVEKTKTTKKPSVGRYIKKLLESGMDKVKVIEDATENYPENDAKKIKGATAFYMNKLGLNKKV